MNDLGLLHSQANQLFELARALVVAAENGRLLEGGHAMAQMYARLEEAGVILRRLDPQAVELFAARLPKAEADKGVSLTERPRRRK